MKVTLKKTMVREMSLSMLDGTISSDEITSPANLFKRFEVSARYTEEDDKGFAIVFDVMILMPELDQSELQIELWAFFETNEAITDDFKKSHFPRVNAPAIAYPYLRSFVTTFLVNAGYPALYLPTINFSAMDAEQKK